MRIALVIDTVEPFYRGGYERRAWELARSLASRHDVTVFTSAPHDTIIDNVAFRRVRLNTPYFLHNGFRDLRANVAYAAALARHIRSDARFDVIDCNATPFLHIPVAAALARRSRAAFVVTAHEALSAAILRYFRARGTRTPGLGRTAQYVYHRTQRLADRLVASSAVAAEALRREGYRRVDVCAGGVRECHSPKTNPRGRVTVVGRLVPNKRVDVAVRAFAAAHRVGAVDRLAIVGGGSERSRLERLVADLGLTGRVVFHGEVSETEKTRVLVEETDVFLSASTREGFSLVTLEAMAAGNPVVIADRGWTNGALEYVRDGVNGIVSDGGVDDLKRALMQSLASDHAYRSMSCHAVEAARGYTWDRVAEQLEDIYVDVIGSHRHAQPVQLPEAQPAAAPENCTA